MSKPGGSGGRVSQRLWGQGHLKRSSLTPWNRRMLCFSFSHPFPNWAILSHLLTSRVYILEPVKEEEPEQLEALRAPPESHPARRDSRVLSHSHAHLRPVLLDPRSHLTNRSLSVGPKTDLPALTGLEGGIRRGFPTTWRGVASSCWQ